MEQVINTDLKIEFRDVELPQSYQEYLWMKDWADRINKVENKQPGLYVKNMDGEDPLIIQLKDEFRKRGYNPDNIVLYPAAPESDEDTGINFKAEYVDSSELPNEPVTDQITLNFTYKEI